MDKLTEQKLSEYRIFSDISRDDIPHIFSCIGGTEKEYGKAEYILMEGQEVRYIGIILKGMVQMIKEDVWGNRMILETLSEGDIFGESFVCGDITASTVSFIAADSCNIVCLPFHRLLTTCGMACRFHQRLIENMIVMIAAKNVRIMKKMEIISQKTIRERILLWLSQQVQESGERRFTAKLGRVQMAEYLCTDRSALTRELGRMKAEGLLDYDRNTFELKKFD